MCFFSAPISPQNGSKQRILGSMGRELTNFRGCVADEERRKRVLRASEQRQALYQRQKRQEQERSESLERPWHQRKRAQLLSTLQRIKDSEAVEGLAAAMPASASSQGAQQPLNIKLKIGEQFFRFQASSLREVEDFGAAVWPCCCLPLVPCS